MFSLFPGSILIEVMHVFPTHNLVPGFIAHASKDVYGLFLLHIANTGKVSWGNKISFQIS